MLDLDAALDEYNTFFMVQEALQRLTKGWLGWNGELMPPVAED